MRVISLSLILMLLAVLMPLSAQAQTPQSLDSAVVACARYLQGRFPRGTRAAIVAVQGENREIGEFVVRRLGEVLVNANWFTVVERDAAALATIERETDRHMNFYVSQETEIFIGRQLGAEVIISGSMTRVGANWRLDVHAVTVETARRNGRRRTSAPIPHGPRSQPRGPRGLPSPGTRFRQGTGRWSPGACAMPCSRGRCLLIWTRTPRDPATSLP